MNLYDYLTGTVTDVRPECVVIENQGIGYQLLTPNPYLFHQNEQAKIFTHLYVKEDIFVLYGFRQKDERMMFKRLLSVSGIGPKGALAIMAGSTPMLLIQAIEEENEALLMKFPGIGKKTARQMILDLKGKLKDFDVSFAPDLFHPEGAQPSVVGALSDALEALRALGYAEKEIKKIERDLQAEDCTTEEYVKKGLRLLMQS